MAIQIRGLVKAFRTIRGALQMGLTPDEIEPFRQRIETLLEQVESICKENGGTTEELPTPSRHAYHFLKQIDLNNLPMRSTSSPLQATPHTLHISHVVKTGNQLATRIWQRLDPLRTGSSRRHALLSQIHRHCETIERLCAQNNATPALLELPSRQVYCWLKYISQPGKLRDHLDALALASQVADPFLAQLGSSLQMHMVHTSSLWRLRTHGSVFHFKCSQGLLYANEEVWLALFGTIFSQMASRRESQQHNHTLQTFFASELYTDVMYDLDSFIELPEHSHRGVYHDLEQSFLRVNQQMFEFSLSRPQLHWSHTPTTSKFGHYQTNTDTIMLSTTLDHEEVPEFVIDFVMFHELLHKKHGIQIIDGRRVAHTQAFREEERNFPQYEQAELFLRRWSQRFWAAEDRESAID